MGSIFEVLEGVGLKIESFTTAGRNAITSPSITPAVIDKDLSTPPGGPSPGDRYIVATGGTGAWSGKDTQVADWNGSIWVFTVPVANDTVTVTDEGLLYIFQSSIWQIFRSIIQNEDTGVLDVFDGANWNALGGGGAVTKSGVVAGASFAGNPKTITITFNTAFADANYSVSVIGVGVSRSWEASTLAAGSFIIDSGANTSFTENVLWAAIAHSDP